MNPMHEIPYENLAGLNAPFHEAYRKKFDALLDKGWYIMGEELQVFEANFAKFLRKGHFVGVASGLDALEIPLKIQSWTPDSEIIVPSNTYIATINAILNAGFKPVFVEPDIHTYTIDPTRIEEKISERTKAIMIVHLYGQPCDMDEIMRVCKQYELELIEDCAQSHGATYKGQMTGTFGYGAFSFYPTKNLGALGDAGGILVRDDQDHERIKAWRNYGSQKKYYNKYIGDNSRLDEIQAAFLNIKLEGLNKITEHKRKLAALYREGIDADKFILPVHRQEAESVYHIFPLRTDRRDELKAYLQAKGIRTEIHYPVAPIDQESIQAEFNKKGWTLNDTDFELARKIHATELSLPISTIHSEEDIHYVIECLNEFQ